MDFELEVKSTLKDAITEIDSELMESIKLVSTMFHEDWDHLEIMTTSSGTSISNSEYAK